MEFLSRTLLVTLSALAVLSASAAGHHAHAQAQADDAEKRVEIKAEIIENPQPFLFGLFNAQKPILEPLTEEQVANDEEWTALAKKRKYKIKEEAEPTIVTFSGEKPGTIVVDTQNKFLYFVDSPATAIRYGIAVGQEGLSFIGETTVGNKQVWPRWTPTKQMIERSPGKYKRYADGMDGGLKNPLGARAIYLHIGKQDTYLRIHGTNNPKSIGTASSNGCFRMHNEHVIDLYGRVKMGAKVKII